MKITFGMSLDGYEPPELQNSIGSFVTGPMGLLDLLETRLGLGGEWPVQSLRVVQYQQCLVDAGAANDTKMFYSDSLSVDALAVAETLLGWRDEWVAAGWDGTADASDSQRLQDMARVEGFARKQLGAGDADRLQVVIDALCDRNPGIDEVWLVDPLAALPPAWRKVFARLPVTQDSLDEWSGATAQEGSDLAALQQGVLNNSPVSFQGDGSFFVIESDSEYVLSRAIGESFAASDAWGSDSTTVITGQRGAILDEGLRSVDLPISGLSSKSQWRPAAQVLRLALSLVWKPLDPHRLLEFLTHPVCPLRQPLRSRLARVVANTPGIGGQDWDRVIGNARSEAIEKADGDMDAASAINEQLENWLLFPRFDPVAGAPVALLGEHCARVASWAAACADVPDIEEAQRLSFLAAQREASAAVDVIDAFARGGVEFLKRLQFDQLIDQVSASGARRPDVGAECDHIHVTGEAAAVITAVERVVWWDFSAPILPRKWPWTPAEIEQLRTHGAELPSVDSMLQFAAGSWLRPVMAATRQLVLVMPRRRGNEEFIHHPLWDQILALAGNAKIPRLDLDRELEKGETDSWISFRPSPVGHRSLPLKKRWWNLADGKLLDRRDKESYSSLNSFVDTPHRWVLRHKARLSPGSLMDLHTGNRLKGSLLHRFFEWLFTSREIDWRSANKKSLQHWVDKHFPLLLEQEGSSYLLPGKQREAEELRTTAIDAAWALIDYLRAAQVDSVHMEEKVEGSFKGGRLGGSIDILLSAPGKREAVLDLKWSRFKDRCDDLRGNRQLQLAVYAVMRQQATRQWPGEAYFILDEGRMLAQNDHFFGDAEICKTEDEYANSLTLWAAFEKRWAWRRTQLDDGVIEINVEGTEPDEASVPPEDGLAVAKPDPFDDYLALTGWPEEA